jgi:hypothetical protein
MSELRCLDCGRHLERGELVAKQMCEISDRRAFQMRCPCGGETWFMGQIYPRGMNCFENPLTKVSRSAVACGVMDVDERSGVQLEPKPVDAARLRSES